MNEKFNIRNVNFLFNNVFYNECGDVKYSYCKYLLKQWELFKLTDNIRVNENNG